MVERRGRKTEVFLPYRDTNIEKTSKNAQGNSAAVSQQFRSSLMTVSRQSLFVLHMADHAHQTAM